MKISMYVEGFIAIMWAALALLCLYHKETTNMLVCFALAKLSATDVDLQILKETLKK